MNRQPGRPQPGSREGDILVFTYGTLCRGQANHRLLRDGAARFVGEAITRERFVLFDGPFPRMSRLPMKHQADPQGDRLGHVRGEVWAVDDRTLAALDRLEGHPRFYRRERLPVVVTHPAPEVIAPWGYVIVDWPAGSGLASLPPVAGAHVWPALRFHPLEMPVDRLLTSIRC